MKINLWGNDGGTSAFALISYVKAPTAPVGIGNGATEGGVIAPLSFSLPNDFTLLFNSEVDALKDSTGSGYHANFINLVNLSRPIVKPRRTTSASRPHGSQWPGVVNAIAESRSEPGTFDRSSSPIGVRPKRPSGNVETSPIFTAARSSRNVVSGSHPIPSARMPDSCGPRAR